MFSLCYGPEERKGRFATSDVGSTSGDAINERPQFYDADVPASNAWPPHADSAGFTLSTISYFFAFACSNSTPLAVIVTSAGSTPVSTYIIVKS